MVILNRRRNYINVNDLEYSNNPIPSQKHLRSTIVLALDALCILYNSIFLIISIIVGYRANGIFGHYILHKTNVRFAGSIVNIYSKVVIRKSITTGQKHLNTILFPIQKATRFSFCARNCI